MTTVRPAVWLGVRSVGWACLLPGVVAGWVPWRYLGVARVRIAWGDPVDLLGVALVGLGTALLAACIADFARRGRGTLAPVDPPTALVVEGPYRYVRNPMYIGVSTILLGELAVTRTPALLVYWAAVLTALHLFVVLYEEPALRRRFGPAYEAYARAVGRWIPSRPPRATTSHLPR